jgi:hypothetical protein
MRTSEGQPSVTEGMALALNTFETMLLHVATLTRSIRLFARRADVGLFHIRRSA